MSSRKKKKILTGSKKFSGYYDFSVFREIRKKRSMTIFELSQRSGVPVSVISKIERNKCAAELQTIIRLSESFGIHPSELFRLAEHNSVEKKEIQKRRRKGCAISEISYGNLRIILLEAKEKARIFRPEIHRDDYEICWVLQGKIALNLPRQREIVSEGTALRFDALLKHSYEVLEDSKILMIHLNKKELL